MSLISLFGIANSLFLSIHERTRELGLLRAIGPTAEQVRRLIRYESVITALVGGLLGTAIGLLFGWLTTVAIGDLGVGLPCRSPSSPSSSCSRSESAWRPRGCRHAGLRDWTSSKPWRRSDPPAPRLGASRRSSPSPGRP